MAVEGAASVVLLGLLDMATDLGNDRGTEGDVGDKVTVPVYRRVSVSITPSALAGNKHATYMMSTCNQSAPCSMVRAQSWPRLPKSADRMDGAMMVWGAMVRTRGTWREVIRRVMMRRESYVGAFMAQKLPK